MNVLPNNLSRYMDDDGRIFEWPGKRYKQAAILEYLATKFELGRTYSEAGINEVLKQWHTFNDWALLRRDMVDAGILSRDKYGHEYKLVPPAESEEPVTDTI